MISLYFELKSHLLGFDARDCLLSEVLSRVYCQSFREIESNLTSMFERSENKRKKKLQIIMYF